MAGGPSKEQLAWLVPPCHVFLVHSDAPTTVASDAVIVWSIDRNLKPVRQLSFEVSHAVETLRRGLAPGDDDSGAADGLRAWMERDPSVHAVSVPEPAWPPARWPERAGIRPRPKTRRPALYVADVDELQPALTAVHAELLARVGQSGRAARPNFKRHRPLVVVPLPRGADVADVRTVLNAAHAATREIEASVRADPELDTTKGLDIVLAARDRTCFVLAQKCREHLMGPNPAGMSDRLFRRAQQIAGDAADGSSILFLGSGAGVNAGLPAWEGLLWMLARDHAGLDEATTKAVVEDIQKAGMTLLDSATLVEAAIQAKAREAGQRSSGALGRAVAELIRSSDTPSLQHHLAACIPFRGVVTTNYDTLMEQATRAADRGCDLLPYEAVLPRGPADSVDRRWVLKMHGCVTEPDDIVLTREHYAQYGNTKDALAGVLQNALLTKKVLFMGFSLTDPNFHRVLHSVKACKQPRGLAAGATLASLRSASGAGGAGGPSAAEADTAFGVSLSLRAHQAAADLWKGQVDVVPMVPASDLPANIGNTDRSSRASLWLEALLDTAASIAALAMGRTMVLEPTFHPLLSENDLLVKRVMQDWFDSMPSGARWSRGYAHVEALNRKLLHRAHKPHAAGSRDRGVSVGHGAPARRALHREVSEERRHSLGSPSDPGGAALFGSVSLPSADSLELPGLRRLVSGSREEAHPEEDTVSDMLPMTMDDSAMLTRAKTAAKAKAEEEALRIENAYASAASWAAYRIPSVASGEREPPEEVEDYGKLYTDVRRGHVLVVRGSLHHIEADACMAPVGNTHYVHRRWYAAHESDDEDSGEESPDGEWLHDETELCQEGSTITFGGLPWPSPQGGCSPPPKKWWDRFGSSNARPIIIPTQVAPWPKKGWPIPKVMEQVRRFFRYAVQTLRLQRRQPRNGRARFRFALPLVSTGQGGNVDRKGDVLESLLHELEVISCNEDLGFPDVVLVTHTNDSFVAAQVVRCRVAPCIAGGGVWQPNGLNDETMEEVRRCARVSHTSGVCAVVGDVFSRAAGAPAREHIAAEIARELWISSGSLSADCLSAMDPRDAAQAVALAHKAHPIAPASTTLHAAARRVLDGTASVGPTVSPAHYLVASLGVTTVVTEAQDTRLERAFRFQHGDVAVLPWKRPQTSDCISVLPMRGTAARPSSLVLTRDDHESNRTRTSTFTNLLHAQMLLTKHLLFVGFDPRDVASGNVPHLHGLRIKCGFRAQQRNSSVLSPALATAMRDVYTSSGTKIVSLPGDLSWAEQERWQSAFLDAAVCLKVRAGAHYLMRAEYSPLLWPDDRVLVEHVQQLLSPASPMVKRPELWDTYAGRAIREMIVALGGPES